MHFHIFFDEAFPLHRCRCFLWVFEFDCNLMHDLFKKSCSNYFSFFGKISNRSWFYIPAETEIQRIAMAAGAGPDRFLTKVKNWADRKTDDFRISFYTQTLLKSYYCTNSKLVSCSHPMIFSMSFFMSISSLIDFAFHPVVKKCAPGNTFVSLAKVRTRISDGLRENSPGRGRFPRKDSTGRRP